MIGQPWFALQFCSTSHDFVNTLCEGRGLNGNAGRRSLCPTRETQPIAKSSVMTTIEINLINQSSLVYSVILLRGLLWWRQLNGFYLCELRSRLLAQVSEHCL